MNATRMRKPVDPDPVYVGCRHHGRECEVLVYPRELERGEQRKMVGAPLPVRLELANHSPTGFEWGYRGSGPAQLAVALLAHATGDDALAVAYHQAFKTDVVAGWDGDDWRISRSEIIDWLEQFRRKG